MSAFFEDKHVVVTGGAGFIGTMIVIIRSEGKGVSYHDAMNNTGMPAMRPERAAQVVLPREMNEREDPRMTGV